MTSPFAVETNDQKCASSKLVRYSLCSTSLSVDANGGIASSVIDQNDGKSDGSLNTRIHSPVVRSVLTVPLRGIRSWS
jgi:hypothetical protein